MPPITPEKVEIQNIGSGGIVRDRPGHLLPPGAWTDGNNIRFNNNTCERTGGHEPVFAGSSVVPYQLFNVPGLLGESFWIYLSLTSAWAVESGIHTDITRTVGGAYTTVNGRDWCPTLLAGVPILTNNIDVPQWWPSLDVGTKLANLPNWDANKRCKRIIAWGSYVFALNLTETGTRRPHKILVSHKADPGSVPNSWDPSDATKDATEFELTDAEGGEILDALPLVDQLIVYKEFSAHSIRFQGGGELWKRDRLFENVGILAPRCVCSFKEGTMHFVATQNDLIVHSGSPGSSQSIVEGIIREQLFDSIDATNYANSFCFAHPKRPELWFAFPETGNTYPNRACVYNYVSKTTAFVDFSGLSIDFGLAGLTPSVTWDASTDTWDTVAEAWQSSARQVLVFCDPVASKFYELDAGLDFDGYVFPAFLERVGLAYEGKTVRFGQRILIDRVWIKANGLGKWKVRVGMQETREAEITWSTEVIFDPAGMGGVTGVGMYVDVDPPANGRIPAIRFESYEALPSELEGYDLRVSPLGEF